MNGNNNEEHRKVLSIQSHVVSGYVGNKCATFVLQLLGFQADALNSVQFSNHKGYPHCKGHVLSSEQLTDLFDGLKLNNITAKYSHVLTGFVGSADFLSEVYEIVKQLKENNKKLMYVCDPVMGDAGQFYVSRDVLPIFRDKLVSLADVITPNQFEAELLTGIQIKTETDALAAMDVLHMKGVPIVIISSSELGDDRTLVTLASTKYGSRQERLRMKIPLIPTAFVGTGDLFAALTLAWLSKTGYDLKLSLERTASTLQDILNKTYDYALNAEGGLTFENLELKLIENISTIRAPKVVLQCETI